MRRWRGRASQGNHELERDPEGSDRCPYDNEFDAFLAGRYADWLSNANRSVPAWAWVNKVAHATIEEIHTLAMSSPPATAPAATVPWHRVSALLAKEVLVAVGDDKCRLAALQREALVPAELQLARHWWAVVSPIDLATVTVEAVHRAPLSSERDRKEKGDESQ